MTASCYEPFGAQEALGGEGSPYGFVGKQGVRDDGDAGLLLMGHRYYDPSLGRFLSRDSMPGQLDSGYPGGLADGPVPGRSSANSLSIRCLARCCPRPGWR